jgi:hypothetical protein
MDQLTTSHKHGSTGTVSATSLIPIFTRNLQGMWSSHSHVKTASEWWYSHRVRTPAWDTAECRTQAQSCLHPPPGPGANHHAAPPCFSQQIWFLLWTQATLYSLHLISQSPALRRKPSGFFCPMKISLPGRLDTSALETLSYQNGGIRLVGHDWGIRPR